MLTLVDAPVYVDSTKTEMGELVTEILEGFDDRELTVVTVFEPKRAWSPIAAFTEARIGKQLMKEMAPPKVSFEL